MNKEVSDSLKELTNEWTAIRDALKKNFLSMQSGSLKPEDQELIMNAYNIIFGMKALRISLDVMSESKNQQHSKESDKIKATVLINEYAYIKNLHLEIAVKTKQQRYLSLTDRIFNFLFKFYGIECPRTEPPFMLYPDKVSFIERAILSISIIYRGKWRKTFNSILEHLTSFEDFLAYCCLIPLEQSGPYFYSVLQRMAVIFEMALFCFVHGYDYFEGAIHCAALCFDIDFFEKAGNLAILQKAAEVVCDFTFDLRKIVTFEKPEGYSAETKAVKECSAKFDSGTEELCDWLDDKNFDESCIPAEKKRIPFDNFKHRFNKDWPEDLEGVNLDKAEDYIIDLESWTNVSTRRKVEEVFKASVLLQNLKECKQEDSGISTKVSVLSEETDEDARDELKQRKPAKHLYVPLRGIEYPRLYRNALPIFLTTCRHKYFTPQFEDFTLNDCNDFCFILPCTLFTKLIGRSQQSKRLYGKCHLGFDSVLPKKLQRKLDGYITNGLYRLLISGADGEFLYIVGEYSDIDKLSKCAVWNIKGYLDEVIDNLHEGISVFKDHKKFFLRNPEHCISSTVEDFDVVWKFRRNVMALDSNQNDVANKGF